MLVSLAVIQSFRTLINIYVRQIFCKSGYELQPVLKKKLHMDRVVALIKILSLHHKFRDGVNNVRYKFSLPEQICWKSSNLYPGGQVSTGALIHMYEPIVFWQALLLPQLSTSNMHSSISNNNN